MKYKLRKAIVLLALLGLIVGAGYGAYQFKQNTSNELMTLDGQPAGEITAQLLNSGTPVLIVYWTIDCPYCQEQLMDLNQIGQMTQGQMVILAVNVRDSADKVAKFVWRFRYMIPLTGPAPRNMQGTPYTQLYLNGQMIDQWMGYVEGEQMWAELQGHFGPADGG